MNRNYFSKIILLIGLSCSATALAAPVIDSDVASLINQRLSFNVLSASILSGIRAQLAQGKPFTDKAAFLHTLDQANLEQGDKTRLWEALQKISLKK